MGLWRLNSSGVWGEVKRVYRLNSSGNWVALKNIWRLNSSGIWQSIFNAPSNPTIKPANPPLLYFRDGGGFETTSQDIANATASNLTSPATYDGDKVYLTRGAWSNEPLSFVMSIQKSQNQNFSSGVSAVNSFSNQITRTYTSYSDSNSTDQIPLSSTNRYTITKADVRDGFYFRGYIEATNDLSLMGSHSTSVVLPRMYANVSFSIQNAGPPISYVSNPQPNGGTFSWSYTGNSTIQAQDISEQLFLVYPFNDTSGNALYSTAIFAGTGTSTPTSTVTFTSANLNPNTQYTVVIKTTMQDGWSANSNSALRTIITDQKSFTTAQAKPLAPTNVTGTDVGTNRPFNNGAISLSWSQASNGTTITGYKIEYATGPNYLTYQTLVANTGNTNTFGTFTGLSSNTNYKFVVTAIGSLANSDPSAESNAVLITTVPSTPTGVSAVAGNATANVSFTASAFNGGKSIIEYRATSTPGSIVGTEVISPIPVTGLTNYTAYTFTVAARNNNGYSAESNASNSVTPQLPAPVGSGTVTIASNSNANYIYQITSYGTWSNSATTYDYEWQTSSDGGTNWNTRASGTNVATIPNYNASLYKAQSIRLRVYGRNQTGPAITPLVSNTLTIFYTTPVINTFSVTGGELLASYSYTYSADDPSPSVSLEYKLSAASTWTSIVSPTSPGTVTLSSGTYDFRLSITNSANGAFRVATSTVSSIVISNIYSFSFGNILYPSTNGHIGLTGGSTTTIPSTGKYLAVFPGDYVGNTGASPGYTLVWSDSTKYVIRFDGYRFGFVGQAAYRLEWMATFYSSQNYVDIKIITKGSSISGSVTAGLYKDGVLVAGLPGPYTLSTGSTFRINYDGSTGSFGITYDEISIAAPNDIMTTAGTLTGSSDDGFFTITTAQNVYKSPVVTIGTISGGTSTLSIPFTESNGCDSVAYNIRTGSYSGTIIQSSSVLGSPINLSSLSANTTYYITLTPFNYKSQSGSVAQTTAVTAPPQPTVTFSSVTSSSFTVSWSATGATHYYVDIYRTSNGLSLSGYPLSSTTNTSASPFGLSANTNYTAIVYPRNSSAGFLGDPRVVSQTTLFSGLTPTFGTNTRVSGGFNGSVTNYDANYTWGISTNSGSVSWGTISGSTRTFSVTGLTAGGFATVTVSTSRSGYDPGSNTTTGQALSNLITNPAYGAATSNSSGWTASISTQPNPTGGTYSVISQTAGSASVNSSTGALTASGLSAGQSSTVTVRYSLSGYNPVDITASGSALALTKLSTPTGVNASDNRTDGVLISWNAVSEAAYYGVWYGPPAPSYDSTPDFGGPNNPTLITGTSYLDTSLGSGVTRDYYVQAFRTNNPTNTKSEWSAGDSGTRLASVSPPVNTVAPSVTPSSGTAGVTQFSSTTGTWTNSPTSYSYQWQYLDQGTTYISISGATSSTYTPPSNYVSIYGSSLRCRVTATNSGGSNSANSNTVTVSAGGGGSAPATPTGVGLTGSGVVSWTASSGATSYEIEFYTAQDGSGLNAAPTGPTGYTVTGISASPYQLVSPYASPNNWARVRVRARNSNGASAYSAWVPSATTYT